MSEAANVLDFNTKREGEVSDRKIADMQGIINALNRTQAVIEFNLDGTIVNANDNFLNAMGYTLNEIAGRHHSMFVEKGYANSMEYRSFWERLNRGIFDTGEYKRLGKNGKEIWIQATYNPVFDTTGKVIKVVKFATDVTASRLEKAEFEGKMNAISKAQAVIEFNLDGTVVVANDNFLNVLGYSLNEIKGKHHRMFVDSAYQVTNEYRAFWEKLNRGEYDSGEYKRIGKGGREVWIQASYNPIFDMNGRVFKVVKYATDITAAKKARSEFEQKVAAISEAILSSGSQLNATAQQMSMNADATSNQSATAAGAAQEVAAGVQSVATNTEEMVASIKEIARSANESAEMSKSTLRKSQETNKTITQLGTSSQEIGNVIKVISSIAQQTNLLALNATIEAARAGDAGKGFAVVANEVKELAKQTAKATEEITSKIGAIQKDSQGAVDAIGDISSAIDKLNAIAGAIAASVEEQTATANEVSRVVQESSKGVEGIATTIRAVSEGAQEATSAAKQTLGAANGLNDLAKKLQALMTEVKL